MMPRTSLRPTLKLTPSSTCLRAVEGGDVSEFEMRLSVGHADYQRLRPRSQTRRTMAKLLMKRISPMHHRGAAEFHHLGHLRNLARDDVQVHRQRHERLADVVGEDFVPAVVGDEFEEGRAGEKDGRGLAGAAADFEDDAGEDAAERIGQDDGADGLPARGAEIPAGFAKGLRHGAERLAGGGDDDGQIHDRDGERGGEQAGFPFRVGIVRIGDEPVDARAAS